jgi:tetratricopeptide (TPR) repeat protein
MSAPPPDAAGSLGAVLAHQRALAGLTQEELAAASGVSVRTISDLERDRVGRPRRRSIELLAGALGLDQGRTRALVAIARGAPGVPGGNGHGEPPPAPTGPGGPRTGLLPRQLPAAPRYFTGRAADLAVMNRWLDGAAGQGAAVVITAIGGTAGVGKSALALAWAHQVADRFPDGQLYVNLRGFDPGGMRAMTPGEAVRGFLDALRPAGGQIPASTQAQAAMYRSLLAGRRMLIVLDNANDAGQVRPLIPASPGCLVVVTSRNQLTGLAATDGAHLLNLDLLTEADARHLLERHLGRSRVAAEPDAAGELIRLCTRLPLALSIAAAYAKRAPDLPLAALARQLRDATTRLDLLDGGDPVSSLRAVFGCSYTKLPRTAARMFRLLGLHSGPDISVPAAASLAGATGRQARLWLRQLTDANLLAEPVPGRYAFHDLIHAYAREQAGLRMTEASRQQALRRLLDHYLHTGDAAVRQISALYRPLPAQPPSPHVSAETIASPEHASEWLMAEKTALLAAAHTAGERGLPGHAWRIAAVLGTFLARAGHVQQAVEILSAALGAAEAADGRLGTAHIQLRLGRGYLGLGSFAEANRCLSRALGAFTLLGDVRGQASAHQYFSLAFDKQGDYREALRHSRLALGMFRAIGEQRCEAGTLNAVGWLYLRLRDYRQGLEYCQQALDLNIKMRAHAAEAETWDSIGYAHHHLGDYSQALACYSEALRLHSQVGSSYYAADTLTHIGDTHFAAGDMNAACDAWQQSLAILDELQHPEADRIRAKLSGIPG